MTSTTQSILRLQLSKENIYVLEKAREIGPHCLSGALLDPRSMLELLPDFETEAPIDAAVVKEAVYFLTRKGRLSCLSRRRLCATTATTLISINRFVKWLGARWKRRESPSYRIRAAVSCCLRKAAFSGCAPTTRASTRTGSKANFEPGYDSESQGGDSRRGQSWFVTKQLIGRLPLDNERNPQTYGIGVKELWELPPGRIALAK